MSGRYERRRWNILCERARVDLAEILEMASSMHFDENLVDTTALRSSVRSALSSINALGERMGREDE